MSLENVIVSEDMVKTTEKLVDFMYDKIVETLKTKKIATIGLSGAEMIPLVTNELVKRKETFIKFKNSLVFLACDERFVPLDHVDSNFGEYISRGLFKELVIPSKNLFAIDYEASEEVEKCAVDYDQRLRKVLNENNGFDILLLGVGPDGHTCSLFPNHRLYLKAHQINDVVVSISDSPKLPPKRVTLSLNCINNSTNLIFLCGIGSNPATLRNILIDKNIDLPATGIKSNVNNGIVKWFLDKEAAALL